MIIGLDHVGVSVVDMNRALGFYRDLLGLEILTDGQFGSEQNDRLMRLPNARGRVVLLQHPQSNLRVELFEFAAPAPKPTDRERPVCDHGITHLCIQVGEIDAEYERLAAAGVSFHAPPTTFPSGNRAAYGRDPDGNVFELWEHKQSAS